MFKKIIFFLFFISSVSIPGYYFYQRSKSKKEESYPVNNKEEIKKDEKEEIQEEKEDQLIKNEEVALVEINGWLDCLLLNTIFYFLIFCLFLTLFKVRLDMLIMNEANKVTDQQLRDGFVIYLANNNEDNNNAGLFEKIKGSINSENINNIIETKIKNIAPLENANINKLLALEFDLERLYKIQYCLANNKFFFVCTDFIGKVITSHNDINLEMKFPTISSIILFIITHILLSYDLYFFLKSFWQVGFSKTFENFNWLDLFSMAKVFRRNSIVKKIVPLVLFILTTGFTFAWAFFKEYRPKARNFSDEVKKKLEKKITDRKLANCLPIEVEEQIQGTVAELKQQLY